MKKRWPSIVLGLVVSVIALGYLFRRDLSDVQDELLGAHYGAVILCIVLLVMGLWLRSLRWRVLLDDRITVKHSFHILNISYFINAVLPLRVGELVRAVLAARIDPPVRVLTSLSTILVERLLDVLAVFVLVGAALVLLPAGFEVGIVGVLFGVGAVAGMVVLGIFAARPAWAHTLLHRGARIVPLLRRPALHEWLDHLLDGISLLSSPRRMVLAVGWTAAGWAVSATAGYIILYAIFDDPTWAATLAMIAAASFAVAVPAVPGNLGPFEAAVVFGLAAAGLVEEATDAPAVALAILLHAVNLTTYIVLGLIGLWVEDVRLSEVTRAAQLLRNHADETRADSEAPGVGQDILTEKNVGV